MSRLVSHIVIESSGIQFLLLISIELALSSSIKVETLGGYVGSSGATSTEHREEEPKTHWFTLS